MEKYQNEEDLTLNDADIVELHNQSEEYTPDRSLSEAMRLEQVVLEDGTELSLQISNEDFATAKAEMESLRPEINELFKQLEQLANSKDKSAFTKFLTEHSTELHEIGFALALTSTLGCLFLSMLSAPTSWNLTSILGLGSLAGSVGIPIHGIFRGESSSKNDKIEWKSQDLQKLIAEFTNSLSKTREATTRALLAEGATVEDVTITDSEYLNQIGESAKIFSVTPEQKDAAKQVMEDDLSSRG